MEDQAVKIVGEVGKRQFRFSTRDPNRADKQSKAILLMGEDVLNTGANR